MAGRTVADAAASLQPETVLVLGLLGFVAVTVLPNLLIGKLSGFAGEAAGAAGDAAAAAAEAVYDNVIKPTVSAVNIVPETKDFFTGLFVGVETREPVYSLYGEPEYFLNQATTAERVGNTTREQFITLYDEPLLDVSGVTIIPSVEGSFEYLTEGSILNDTLSGIKKVFGWIS